MDDKNITKSEMNKPINEAQDRHDGSSLTSKDIEQAEKKKIEQ